MKRLITTFNIFLLAALSSSFAFAEDTDGMHEGCTIQHPMWECGHCMPGTGGEWPDHLYMCHMPSEGGDEVLYYDGQPATQAQLEATWTGCGPESAHGSCYGKPAPPSPIPPQKDKCMGMGCNPDTWSPTPVN
jgi:hypothetical protein